MANLFNQLGINLKKVVTLQWFELWPSQIVWGLRRLYWGLPGKAVVLEIGSGGNPCPRADVLVDFSPKEHEQSRQLVVDRPTILCCGEKLPFKDNAFDFVITIHTLEHSSNPRAFLKEMQRVGRAGYIETPAAINELFAPYKFHRSFVWVENDCLHVWLKPKWNAPLDEINRKMLGNFFNSKQFINYYRKNPKLFNVSFKWKKSISFTIHGKDKFTGWEDTEVYHQYGHHQQGGGSFKQFLRPRLPKLIRAFMGYSGRQISIEKLLQCPECKKQQFRKKLKSYICSHCSAVINFSGNLFWLQDNSKSGSPK